MPKWRSKPQLVSLLRSALELLCYPGQGGSGSGGRGCSGAGPGGGRGPGSTGRQCAAQPDPTGAAAGLALGGRAAAPAAANVAGPRAGSCGWRPGTWRRSWRWRSRRWSREGPRSAASGGAQWRGAGYSQRARRPAEGVIHVPRKITHWLLPNTLEILSRAPGYLGLKVTLSHHGLKVTPSHHGNPSWQAVHVYDCQLPARIMNSHASVDGLMVPPRRAGRSRSRARLTSWTCRWALTSAWARTRPRPQPLRPPPLLQLPRNRQRLMQSQRLRRQSRRRRPFQPQVCSTSCPERAHGCLAPD